MGKAQTDHDTRTPCLVTAMSRTPLVYKRRSWKIRVELVRYEPRWRRLKHDP